ncbi:MAG: NAD(+)/NADH kinase [Bacteroides sp.]|nr:NAD(+)/NADH kinase [Bacteroides sp.]MCM1413845.1 NAD(+)/NADH kinase [Bacteroides sp.]MCM1471046.1 NAD(+)/NADH kinase [Bacteroides sp.]
MKKIVIFGNKSQKTGFERLENLFAALKAHCDRLDIELHRRYMDFLHAKTGMPLDSFRTFDIYDGMADMALSIGGDGTFLTTAASVGAYETPILGINSGHLGYLATTELTDGEEIARRIIEEDYMVEERSLISVECSEPVDLVRRYALNEVAILKQDTASMITVSTSIDGRPLANYRGDGLIISTPTGSTGYNLSVGGPIIAPTASDWVVSPIAPHSLTMRPLVLTDDHMMEIATESRADTYLLSVDGKATALPLNTRVTLRKAYHSIYVVLPRDYNFVDSLRSKLLWGLDNI